MHFYEKLMCTIHRKSNLKQKFNSEQTQILAKEKNVIVKLKQFC